MAALARRPMLPNMARDGGTTGNAGQAERTWRAAFVQLALSLVMIGAASGAVMVALAQGPTQSDGVREDDPGERQNCTCATGDADPGLLARALAENGNVDTRAVDVFLVDDLAVAEELGAAIQGEAVLRRLAGEAPRSRSVHLASPGAATAWQREAEAIHGEMLRVIDLRAGRYPGAARAIPGFAR
jgi:hypothetical protein